VSAKTEDIGKTRYYYIESDGKVYLEEHEGTLQFTKEPSKLPFEIVEKKNMEFNDYSVIYSSPVLDKHPEHWHSKDEIPGMANVHHVVLESLHMSFPRCVAEGMIIKDEKVILVNASRGVTRGFWNLPGGFMEYGESPDECILRELKEEIGIDARVVKLLNVTTKSSAYHPFYLIAFIYQCESDSYDFEINPDEISEVKWFDIDNALNITKSHFTRQALMEYKKFKS
jgi:8-oxo-dGTP diphosphatase